MAQIPSNEYWAKRAESRMLTYEQQAKLTERLLKKAYQNAQRNIDAEIRQLYQNYRHQYGLSAKEAEAFLAQPVDRATYLRLRQEIKGVTDPETLRILEARAGSGAYGFRIQRQEALKLHVDAQMAKLAETEIGTDTAFFRELIPEAYNRTIFDIQRGTGLNFTFGQMDTASIRRILTNPWSGQHFSARIWNNTGDLARLLNAEIPAAFAAGTSVQKVSRDIASRMGIGYRESERLVRTEMSYMANTGTMEGYLECGDDKYRFLATLDSVTSAICQKLDLQVFLVNRAQTGINMPPMHPNCRSTTIPYIGDAEMAQMERWAMDPATGELRKVAGNMTYAEWRTQYVDGNTVSSTAMAAQSGDNGQYARYRQVLGKGKTGTFDEFQAVKRYDPETWSLMKTDYRRQHRLLEDPSLELPNAAHATAADAKFTGYLFNPQTPDGWAKGVAFTSRLGYTVDNWDLLQKEILRGAERYPAAMKKESQYGTQYEQKMVLYGTGKQAANVVVAWASKGGDTWMTSAYIKELKKGE